jgi:hypothetical protein
VRGVQIIITTRVNRNWFVHNFFPFGKNETVSEFLTRGIHFLFFSSLLDSFSLLLGLKTARHICCVLFSISFGEVGKRQLLPPFCFSVQHTGLHYRISWVIVNAQHTHRKNLSTKRTHTGSQLFVRVVLLRVIGRLHHTDKHTHSAGTRGTVSPSAVSSKPLKKPLPYVDIN